MVLLIVWHEDDCYVIFTLAYFSAKLAWISNLKVCLITFLRLMLRNLKCESDSASRFFPQQ